MNDNKNETCARCGAGPFVRQDLGAGCAVPGYATRDNGDRVCYWCCAVEDIEHMRAHGRVVLYLTNDSITNWPGTLRFKVTASRKGTHNIARTRIDAWFRFDGHYWHGVQYGEFTQLIHCKKTRETY